NKKQSGNLEKEANAKH
ncbi:unnamed protein product, partial [Rotaria socialis]